MESKTWLNSLGIYSKKQIENILANDSARSEIIKGIKLVESIENLQWNFQTSEFGNSQLLKAIIKMRASLKRKIDEAESNKWIVGGVALFADLMKETSGDIKTLCDTILARLVNYLNANQGAIFLHNPDQNILEGISFYAYEKKRFAEKIVGDSEGLLGQCFMEGDVIHITEVPQAYIKITSGLGQATPQTILISPIKLFDQKIGVIELASFKYFEPTHIELIKKVLENLGGLISNIKNAKHTSHLLTQSIESSRSLKVKEEQLLQNIEELTATQEEMVRQQTELAYAKKMLEEKQLELEMIQQREMELIESKLQSQNEIHQIIIKKLQSKIQALQLTN